MRDFAFLTFRAVISQLSLELVIRQRAANLGSLNMHIPSMKSPPTHSETFLAMSISIREYITTILKETNRQNNCRQSTSWDYTARIWSRASLRCRAVLTFPDWLWDLQAAGGNLLEASGANAHVVDLTTGQRLRM